MYFEVAGIEVAPWLPPLVAFVISFFTSMGGVSGAFLLLPFQISVLGFTSPSVSATNQLFNIVAIPSGVIRYIREGRMVMPLAWIVVIGTLPGVFIGAVVRMKYLPDSTDFKLFAGFVLLYIGIRIVQDILFKRNNDKNSAEKKFQELVRNFKSKASGNSPQEKLPVTKILNFGINNLEYEFYGEKFTIPTIKVAIISFVVGIVGGIYGIGGGAIMAPIFVAIFRLPVYTIAGAALFGTFITSIAGVIFYQLLAPYYPGMAVAPDWLLGFLFGIGGAAGMYLGAKTQKYIPAKLIKWILALSIGFISIKYIIGYFF